MRAVRRRWQRRTGPTSQAGGGSHPPEAIASGAATKLKSAPIFASSSTGARRERRGREEQRDGEPDPGRHADHQDVAIAQAARRAQSRPHARWHVRQQDADRLAEHERGQDDPRARADARRTARPALTSPKKNRMNCTGVFHQCSNRFMVSGRSASRRLEQSRDRASACGMNGRIGTSASAGWTPPRYSAAHDRPPPRIT